MSIVARIFGKKIKGLGQALTDQIILLDPKTASEAQIDELDANFQQLSLQLAEAEQSLTREQQEADAIETNYNRKVTAARILGNKAETATDLAEKDKFNASLEALLNEIEKMQSDVEREKAEAVDARNLRDQLNETTRAMAENLKSVRSALKSAERRMESSEAKAAAAKKSAEIAAQLAGIKETGSRFNKVLTAIDKEAAKHEAEAAAAQTRVNLLKPASSGDANIEAAMREAGGEPPKADLQSRLAALNK